MIPSVDVPGMQLGSLVVVGVLVLLAVAAVLLLGRVLLKLVAVAFVVVLAVAVVDQRSALSDCPRTCACSFFGYGLDLGEGSTADACRGVVDRVQGRSG